MLFSEIQDVADKAYDAVLAVAGPAAASAAYTAVVRAMIEHTPQGVAAQMLDALEAVQDFDLPFSCTGIFYDGLKHLRWRVVKRKVREAIAAAKGEQE